MTQSQLDPGAQSSGPVSMDAGQIRQTEWACAGRPFGKEPDSGDRWVVADAGDAILLAVIDGLGHGSAAHEAASRSVPVLAADPCAPLQVLVARCHQAMHETRGAAMSLVRLRNDGRLTWLGVGNVAAHVVGPGTTGAELRASALLSAGIVGYRLPATLHPGEATLGPDELLLLTSDGIADGHLDGIDLTGPAALVAQDILAQHGKSTDDAQVLLARQHPRQ